MFCPNCGKSNPDGSKFCENCGTNMLESNGVQQAAPQQPVAPPPAPVYQQPPQPQYQAPAAPANLSAPLSVGGFLGTMIVMAIPIVNIIMLFVWGFGANANLNRKNLCRAMLILAAIGVVLSILFSIAFGSIFSAFADFDYYSY